jgi:hypothetical protein
MVPQVDGTSVMLQKSFLFEEVVVQQSQRLKFQVMDHYLSLQHQSKKGGCQRAASG